MRASPRTALAFASILVASLMILSPPHAASPYAPDVTASKTTGVTVSSGGTASVDNTATTGVSACISGRTGMSRATELTGGVGEQPHRACAVLNESRLARSECFFRAPVLFA